MILKVQATTEKISQLDFPKLKIFMLQKTLSKKKIPRQFKEWERIFANVVFMSYKMNYYNSVIKRPNFKISK
jgi:hypothetical protein